MRWLLVLALCVAPACARARRRPATAQLTAHRMTDAVLGWGPLTLGQPIAQAQAALTAAGIRFQRQPADALGTRLTFQADGWRTPWDGTAHFDRHLALFRISFESHSLAEAQAVRRRLSARLGPPSSSFHSSTDRSTVFHGSATMEVAEQDGNWDVHQAWAPQEVHGVLVGPTWGPLLWGMSPRQATRALDRAGIAHTTGTLEDCDDPDCLAYLKVTGLGWTGDVEIGPHGVRTLELWPEPEPHTAAQVESLRQDFIMEVNGTETERTTIEDWHAPVHVALMLTHHVRSDTWEAYQSYGQ